MKTEKKWQKKPQSSQKMQGKKKKHLTKAKNFL